MTALSEILPPLDRSPRRRTVIEIYDLLQSHILSGQLKPGMTVSQVGLAKALNVSRTPVREATRMLQEAGLLCAEPNQRCRVVGFDPSDLQALYAKRIVLESLGAATTAKAIDKTGIEQMAAIIADLEGEEAHEDFDVWQDLHRRFHQSIVTDAGDGLRSELELLELRSERYQLAYRGANRIGWWQRGEMEHRELFEAISAKWPGLAGELAARHLARTALELLAKLAPEFDAAALRAALRFAVDGSKAV
jgi:DNA-binding GntR family transcriptional regulator